MRRGCQPLASWSRADDRRNEKSCRLRGARRQPRSAHVVETLLHGSETLSFSRRSVLTLALCVLTNPNMMSDAEAEQWAVALSQ